MNRLLLILIMPLLCMQAFAQAEFPFGTISRRVVDDELAQLSTKEHLLKTYRRTLGKDGAWSDIDYADRAVTEWKPTAHLDRVRQLIGAYVHAESPLYQNRALYTQIISALNYWAQHNFTSTNWWHNEIATPKTIGVALILMKTGQEQVPKQLEDALVLKMTKGDPYKMTGANKSDIAMHYFYRALITQDKHLLTSSLEQLFYPVQLVDGKEGLQYDLSYLQHGPQLYIAGYGEEFLKGISTIMYYVRDTPYAISDEKKQLFIRFLKESYLPIIRAGYIDFNVQGRGISRPNILKKNAGVTMLQHMLAIDPQQRQMWMHEIAKLDSTTPYDTPGSPLHRHYWKGDYTTHSRKGYQVNVRIASARTNRSESGNGENIYGKYMTDGVTNIQVFGPEYMNIMPIWEWDKIPGTTTRDMTADPVLVEQWGALASNRFAGGVSDGQYGCTAMVLEYDSVQAHKAWFFFDQQVVCLGAGITSNSNAPVVTTLNQTWQKGKVKWGGKAMAAIDSLKRKVNTGEYVSHNQVAYLFNDRSAVTLTSKKQTGSWYHINRSRSKESITGMVFKLWINHGVRPVDATYAYSLYPGTESPNKLEAEKVRIITNTKAVQAVEHRGLEYIQAVFYQAGQLETDQLFVEVDQPIILQISKESSGYTLCVADPNQQIDAVRVNVRDKRSGQSKEVRIALPQGAYRGATAKSAIR